MEVLITAMTRPAQARNESSTSSKEGQRKAEVSKPRLARSQGWGGGRCTAVNAAAGDFCCDGWDDRAKRLEEMAARNRRREKLAAVCRWFVYDGTLDL